MKLILLITLFTYIECAELRQMCRSPKIQNIHILDVTLTAAEKLGIDPVLVKHLIRQRVDNYDNLALIAYPLKGQDVSEATQYILQQLTGD